MRPHWWLVVLAVLASATSIGAGEKANVLTDDEKKAGFELIFNGKDLQGWDHKNNWIVDDGAIARKSGGSGLTYKVKKIPDDFELRFERAITIIVGENGTGKSNPFPIFPVGSKKKKITNSRRPLCE